MTRIAICSCAAGLLVGSSTVPALAASSTIVVTVNQFLNSPWVLEGVTNVFAIASFTDSNACTAPGVCNPGSVYIAAAGAPAGTANIDWGDMTATFGTVSDVVSQTGNTGTYNVSASHGFPDEFNCPNPGPPPTSTCGFPVQVHVINSLNSATNGGTCGPTVPTPCVAVKDQPLDPSATPPGFTAAAGLQYSGQIGTFHDENNKATPSDGSTACGSPPCPEFTVTITDWGDGTVVTPPGVPGAFTIDGCGASPGAAAGQGCNILVNVGASPHTYAVAGNYTVKISIGDGSNLKTLQFTSAAHVLNSRPPVSQHSPAAPTQGRNPVHQSTAPPAGPRIPARVGWLAPTPRDFVDAVRIGVLLETATPRRPVYRYPTAL